MIAFFAEIGIKDIHKIFNCIDSKSLDHIYRDGSKCIDSIIATSNILRYIEGSTLLEIDEIIDIDHRAYLIDINLSQYFEEEFSNWDKINKCIIDSNRRSYRE